MCADADTYTSTCVQMTLNHLVKMRTRPTQNVIFTPNAPYIAPYLLCSWRDNEGITSSCLANDLAKNKYRPRHRNAKGWDAAGIWSGTTLLCGCPTKVSPVCRAVPMGFMCTPWKAAKAPCWVKIWGLLESRGPDGSSSSQKHCEVCWFALLPVLRGLQKDLSLCWERWVVLGWAEIWLFSFLAILSMHIPRSLVSALYNGRYFQRGKGASSLMDEWETPQQKRKSRVVGYKWLIAANTLI